MPPMLKFILACFLTLGLLACARQTEMAAQVEQPDLSMRQPAAPTSQNSPITAANCPQLYVLAPGNYIVDVAAGADVVLDPAWHDFHLYCSQEAAARELENMVAAGTVSRGDWRIYSLDGPAVELARNENGRLLLATPARLEGWL